MEPVKRLVRSVSLIVVFVLSLALTTSAGLAAPAVAAPFEDGTVLAGFRPAVSDAAAAAIERQEGVGRVRVIGAGTHVLNVGRGRVAEKIAALKRHGEVAYAEPNYLVQVTAPKTRNGTLNDPEFGRLWGLKNTGQVVNGTAGTAGADIKAEAAWSVTKGSKNMVVGVVDTGIDYTHPDLAANVWSNPGGVGGCPAGTHGYNAIANSCDPMDDNYSSHGTHVSGTIGATGNNSVGVVGVNWTVSLMGLKFLGANGSGTLADAISAIDFAVQAKQAGVNVRVLNNSWGGGGYSQALMDEINRAAANDILFVAAAGNSAGDNDQSPVYPAGYNTPNMVAVAATDQSDKPATFSCYGATTVHLGAPGVSIYSTMRNSPYDTLRYGYLSGTSMAAPHVSGAAALVLSHAALNTAALKAQLLNNVDPVPALAGTTVTGGRLNAYNAIPGFTLSATPAESTVSRAGGTITYTVTLARRGGFADPVTLTVGGLPSDSTATFSPEMLTTETTATLTVVTTSATPQGTYQLTITGTGGTVVPPQTTSVTLTKTNKR